MMKRCHRIEVARLAQREINRQRKESEKNYEKVLKKGLTTNGIFGMMRK